GDGGAGAVVAASDGRGRFAGAGGDRTAAGRSAGRAHGRLLAQLRRRRLAGLVPAGRRTSTGGRRLPGRAVGGHPRPASADRGAVRAGFAGRAAGQPGGDPVVEPGGGAAGARRHRARGAASGLGRAGVAARGDLLRCLVAAVRIAGGRAGRAVVAAGSGVVRASARAAGRVLAAAATWRAGETAGGAAVAATAVARPGAAASRRVRTGDAGR